MFSKILSSTAFLELALLVRSSLGSGTEAKRSGGLHRSEAVNNLESLGGLQEEVPERPENGSDNASDNGIVITFSHEESKKGEAS